MKKLLLLLTLTLSLILYANETWPDQKIGADNDKNAHVPAIASEAPDDIFVNMEFDFRTIEGRLERCMVIQKRLKKALSSSTTKRKWLLKKSWAFFRQQEVLLKTQIRNDEQSLLTREKEYDLEVTEQIQKKVADWLGKRRDWGYNGDDIKFTKDLKVLFENPKADPNMHVVDTTYPRYSGPIISTMQSGRFHGKEGLEQVLIDRYVDVRRIDFFKGRSRQGTPPSQALVRYGIRDVSKMLEFEKESGEDLYNCLLAGADPDHRLPSGITRLHWAAQCDDAETAKAFLVAGANPNIRNEQGQTPLMWAVRYDGKQVAKILIAVGADQKARDKHGKSLEDYRESGAFVTAILDQDLRKVRKLITKVNPNDPISPDSTPLQYACEKVNYDLVKLLLDHNADPNLVVKNTAKNATPLQITFLHQPYWCRGNCSTEWDWRENLKIFTLLLEHGANAKVSPSGFGGWSSLLHWLSTRSSSYQESSQKAVEADYVKVLYEHLNPEVDPTDKSDAKLIEYLGQFNIKPRIKRK